MTYFIVTILLIFPIYLYEKPNKTNAFLPQVSRYYYIFECLLLIALFGFRNYVGGDTISYMFMWDIIPSLDEINLLNFAASRFMPFWYLFCAMCKSVNGEFWVLTLAHAAVVNIAIFYVIKEMTKYKFTAVLIYFLWLSFYFNCEIMRESIAVCIFLLAMPYYMKRKWVIYYFLCFVAYMFHSSAVLCFLYPLLYKFSTDKLLKRSLLLISTIALILFVGPIFETISNQLPDAINIFKSDKYNDLTNATWLGTVREIFASFLLFIIIRNRDKYFDNNIIDTGLKFYWLLITLGIGMHIMTNRFANYFSFFIVILIVQTLWNNKYKNVFAYLFIINIIFGQYRLYTRESSKLSLKEYAFYEQFYPYYSIFEDVPESIKENRIQYMTSDE